MAERGHADSDGRSVECSICEMSYSQLWIKGPHEGWTLYRHYSMGPTEVQDPCPEISTETEPFLIYSKAYNVAVPKEQGP